MSQQLSAPLVAVGTDMSAHPDVPISVRWLRDSTAAIAGPSETFRILVRLMAIAYHQVPAGSLPDDDNVLSHFAALPLSRWQKVRNEALAGFTRSTDGRLYHIELAKHINSTVKPKGAPEIEYE